MIILTIFRMQVDDRAFIYMRAFLYRFISSEFGLGCNLQSVQNVYGVVSKLVKFSFRMKKNTVPFTYELVTDSINIIIKKINQAPDVEEGISKFCVFPYGGVSHTISFVIKSLVKIKSFTAVFEMFTNSIHFILKKPSG